MYNGDLRGGVTARSQKLDHLTYDTQLCPLPKEVRSRASLKSMVTPYVAGRITPRNAGPTGK